MNLFLPSDIFGSLMFLVNEPNMTFHAKIIDLIYKLVFFGLKKIDFSHISYFALVFASQMLVLEYYNEHLMLERMLSFFFYRFLLFHVVGSFGLSFESLFETRPGPGEAIAYCLRPEVDVRATLQSVNLRVAGLVNQVSFCRSKSMEELMKLKVVERIHQSNPPSKDELKKRFFKIEELDDRNLFGLLMLMHKNNKADHPALLPYNNTSLLKNYLIGTVWVWVVLCNLCVYL